MSSRVPRLDGNEKTKKVDFTVFRITVSNRWQSLFLAFENLLITPKIGLKSAILVILAAEHCWYALSQYEMKFPMMVHHNSVKCTVIWRNDHIFNQPLVMFSVQWLLVNSNKSISLKTMLNVEQFSAWIHPYLTFRPGPEGKEVTPVGRKLQLEPHFFLHTWYNKELHLFKCERCFSSSLTILKNIIQKEAT